jgi:hypothetical protein
MYELVFNGKWTIKQLEPGTLFKFLDSVDIALKSEYRTNGKCDCYLVESGEYVVAPDDTEVIALRVIHTGDDN